jgi:DNA repair exonuclease SbcCD nuclease subunit
MPRVALVFRTDTHVADKSPASWKGDYPAEIWSNLEQIGQLAKARDATAVLDGGDYFHIKTARRTSHGAIRQTAELHKGYPCPVFCVEGNHDLEYNNLASIEHQPLGVLYSCGVFRHLREAVFEDGGLRVRVVGVPYDPRRSLADLLAIQKKPGDDFLVAVVHALASENPPSKVEDFFGEPVFRYADLATPDGPDVWMFGHWHRDQGIVELAGKRFVNQGAVSRGALTRENTERAPKVSLVEFSPSLIQTTEHPLVVAPAADVFDMERKERGEAEARSIDAFVQLLQADASFDPTKTIESNIEAMDFAADVRELALKYLAQPRGG